MPIILVQLLRAARLNLFVQCVIMCLALPPVSVCTKRKERGHTLMKIKQLLNQDLKNCLKVDLAINAQQFLVDQMP